MFSQELNAIRGLTDRFGNERSGLINIKADSQLRLAVNDTVCLATARALLFNRLPEDQIFTLRFIGVPNWPIDDADLPNSYTVLATDGYQVKANEFAAAHPQYEELKKHEEYLAKWVECGILTDKEHMSAVIFAKEMDLRKLHMLMSLFPAFVKKPFELKPLTDEEKQLCVSLTKRTASDFESAIAQIIRTIGLEQEINEDFLKKFANVELERALQSSKNRVTECEEDLEANITAYREIVEQLNEAKVRYEALLLRPKNESTELVDYFRRHKNLELVTVQDETIKFYVKTTLEWFDLDFYRRASANGSIFRFDAPAPFNDQGNCELLMNAIFSDDPEFKIRLCAFYALNTDVGVVRNYDYPEYLLREYMPNPHLQYHSCLGSYRDAIRDALRNSNYIGAIEQCVASCQSINLAETGATFHPFMSNLCRASAKHKVLVDRDGKAYTPKEALKKLKEQA